jgi:hypothetical protein
MKSVFKQFGAALIAVAALFATMELQAAQTHVTAGLSR